MFVCVGAFMELFSLYKPIIEFAGAGASVPLTGFGSVLTDGLLISHQIWTAVEHTWFQVMMVALSRLSLVVMR